MFRFSSSPRFAPLFVCFAAFFLRLPALAQEAGASAAENAANSPVTGAVSNALGNSVGNAVSNTASDVARTGTPSFLSAVDTTLRLWNGQLQKLGPYLFAAIALLAAYLTGLILYQIIFASGTFAPRAASVAAWFSALVLLFFGLALIPLTWPWWSPYAVLLAGLLIIFVMVSSLSKKAA